MESMRTLQGQAESKTDAAIFMPKFVPVAAHTLQVREGPGGFFSLRMNKIAAKPSNYRRAQTIYGRNHCQQSGCVVPNVSQRWAISDTQRMSGYAESVAPSQESLWGLFRTPQTPIDSEFSHNPKFRYHTHAHYGMTYMLSEVAGRGNSPLESHSCAYFSHPRSLSHTHTTSLFFTSPDIDATNGSFASKTKLKKDDFYDPSRKPSHLENSRWAPLEAGRLFGLNSGRSTQRAEAFRSHFPHFQVFGPNRQDPRIPIRVAGEGHEIGSFRARPLAASVNPTKEQIHG